MWARALASVAIAVCTPACFLGGVVEGDDSCDPAPVLAAASRVTVATSCPAEISYHGKTYPVGCAELHPSRLGPVLEHDGGETQYRGARRIRGVPIERLFVLMGPGCRNGHHAAYGEDLTDADRRLLRSPLRSQEKRSGP